VIDAYLSEFDRHLGFDRKLARRVRDEIGSHLAEAAEHDGDEAKAVARFGDPKLLSKSFVESALPGRLRTTGLWLAILAAATFMLMRLRSIWFDLGVEREGLFADLTNVDRAGFVLGLILAGYAWWAIRKAKPNAERAIVVVHAALLSFAISIAASLARAYIVAGPDNLIWLTGAIETSCLIALYWQLRLAFRHAQITQAVQSGE
jgi:hypothetical protein